MKTILEEYRLEVERELHEILQYWKGFTLDETNGGFIGRIAPGNKKFPDAEKGSVLNSRILWTFSAAYNLTRNKSYLSIAERACDYLLHYFIDKTYGGVFWTVTAKGEPANTKKQIYALSFAIYGLSEYYKATPTEKVLNAAIQLYNEIVKYSYDNENTGYIEALSRDWKEMNDIRLSAKDANERKSMNTHLHVLEGFTNLYKVWPDNDLKQKIHQLILNFLEKIISEKHHHLNLFFDDNWTPRSNIISYGHDIEASWLVPEAAEVLRDNSLILQTKNSSIQLAIATLEGVDADGGLWYEYDEDSHHLILEKHSWPQAEAMIGFFNAFQLTGDDRWLKHSLSSWSFVKKYIKDSSGEWHWGVKEDHEPMPGQDKVGIWKCPYHNSRACMEIIKRVNALIE